MVDIASMRIIFESKGWQDLMDKQEKIEKKSEDVGKISEKSSHKQVEGLKQIRKHWKLLTGAIVGAFYSIAKLSPLFASYLSEFGGILGYIYDTVLIPWGDEIESILNLGWAFGEWLDEQPVLVQKFVGGLLIGIPIIFGFAIALSVLNSALIGFGVSGGIAAIGPALGKFAAFLGGASLATLAFGATIGLIIGLIGVWLLKKAGILEWIHSIGAAFGTWLVDMGAKLGTWLVEKGAKFGIWISNLKIDFSSFDDLGAKFKPWLTGLTDNFSTFGGVISAFDISGRIALLGSTISTLGKVFGNTITKILGGSLTIFKLKLLLGSLTSFIVKTIAVTTAFGVSIGLVIGLLGVWILKKTGILDWIHSIGAAFGTWLVDMGAKLGTWLVEKGAKFGIWIADTRVKFKMWVYDTKIWLGELMDKIGDVINKILELGKIIPGGEKVDWGMVLGSNQTGATITQTGIYKLHQGEEVIPSTIAGSGGVGGSEINMTFAPTINVGGGFANSYDARRLADDLRRFWMDDMRSVVGGSHR